MSKTRADCWQEAMDANDTHLVLALLDEDPRLVNQFLRYPQTYGERWSVRYALQLAARKGNLPVVKALLALGADVNYQVLPGGDIPVNTGHIEIIDFLLDHGADINAEGYGMTPPIGLHVYFGDYAVVAHLIKRGAFVPPPNAATGTTLLWGLIDPWSKAEDPVGIAELLVAGGLDVNARAHSGLDDEPIYGDESVEQGRETALHHAAKNGMSALVSYLLEVGADPVAKTVSVRTTDLTQMTKEKKICLPDTERIYFETFDGETPADWAAREGHTEIVRLLT